MKKTSEEIIFNIVAVTITTLFAILCLLPILYTLSGSFTSERELLRGLKLIPDNWSVDAYKLVFRKSEALIRAYWVTIKLVVFGTTIGTFFTAMASYVLYRKDFTYRNHFSFFFFFTTLFSGGLVPHYILNCALGLRNTFAVMLISGLFSVFNMIIIRSYFSSNIPMSLVESAKVDGANDFLIFIKIILPSAGPILATIGLMKAIGYWNNWSTASVYINDSKLFPLQYYLYRIFQEAALKQQMAEAGADMASSGSAPGESYKMAMTVFTMGPVILFYPFVQKFFVSGVTIGAVKE